MNQMMLYNHSGFENRGCEAIVVSTSEMFAKSGQSILLCSDTPEFDRGKTDENIAKVISSTISPYSVDRIINSIGFRLGMSRESEVARKYAPVIRGGKRKLCLSVGGDTYCYGYQEHMQVINTRLKAAGSTLALWGCSMDEGKIEDQVLRDLKAYDLIVPRESLTAGVLSQAGLPVKQWIDPAFYLRSQPVQLPKQWQEGKTIGINISPLVLKKSGNEQQVFDCVKALILWIMEHTEYSVALIPHVMWAHDNDLDVLNRLSDAISEWNERVFPVPDSLSAMQYKFLVSKCVALITARTHLSIAAYSQSIPVLVIGYSMKARGIARDIYGNEEGHLIPVQRLKSETELIGQCEQLLSRLRDEKTFLQNRMKTYMEGKTDIIETILKLPEG